MKVYALLGLFFVGGLLLVFGGGSGSSTPSPAPVRLEITSADTGSATREKYLAIYDANLRKAAASFAERLKADEFPDSLSAVKAWSAMARDAGLGASKGVDLRITELVKQEKPQQVEWVEDFAR